MENNNIQTESPEDRYCDVLRAYYERLKEERKASPSSNAIEEVKLRLFLSLLDRPRESQNFEGFNASPL